MTPGLQFRELFHLSLLFHLAQRLKNRAWAVKGGICLRFFHRSPRMSEDMDLDIEPLVRPDTLRKAVDTILASRAFRNGLAARGAADLRFSAPKQTGTVQRWKIALSAPGSRMLPTKVEFSRRRERPLGASGIPDPETLQRHAFHPFAARFYDAPEMTAQKILAVAADSRHAARDLFDLDHLFHTIRVDPAKVSAILGDVPESAVRNAGSFSFADFNDQVVPYLDESLMDHYKTRSNFEALRARVLDSLAGMRS